MTTRRLAPLVACTAAALLLACNNVGTDVRYVPYGFLTVIAQRSGAGYTANATGTFYSASGLGLSSSTTPWDSCRAQNYSSGGGTSLGTVFQSMNAGTSIQLRMGTRTDSLYPAAYATEIQYRSNLSSGIPYTPGDSVLLTIPGSTGDLGYPSITFRGKSSEAFTVQDFGTPSIGSTIDLRWTQGQDANNTMVFSFRFADPGVDSLSAQIICQFRDDGAATVPAKYVAAWVASSRHVWTASRVRSIVQPVSNGGYFDFISTFDVPTPVAP